MTAICFAQMLASRLCHDLITPISAVNTGLELLENCSEDDRIQLMALSLQSAQTASRRLVFYRAAFGYSAAKYLNSIEVLNMLISDFLKPQKVSVTWIKKPVNLELLEQEGTVTEFSRIILNLILIASEVAPTGGEMKLGMDVNKDDWHFKIDFSGSLVQMRTEIKSALQDNLEENLYSPQTIQAVMTRILLNENKVEIDELSSSKEALTLQVSHKFNQKNINGMLF